MTYYAWFSVPCLQRNHAKNTLNSSKQRYEYKEGQFYDQIKLWCVDQESLVFVEVSLGPFRYCRV
ncbi:hypothetical protein DF3PA_260018 [Candidatus Defluviicoccus seviourii]|uniref:Uncharacterized protein n=1 Tax=Candidatus Defluviicoccus seviourii TaxID=2565273 RepID=A0A564WDV5_9PROT|nr:hypothetical protein DF3PA_260018 [Candidatus Defluviicoccus seviourii]